MSVQIIINGENAQESLLELSALAAGMGVEKSATVNATMGATSVVTAPPVAPQTVAPQTVVAPAYQQQPVYQVPTQQVAPSQPVQGGVPITEAPTYTFEQLGVAAGPLVDAGRSGELTAWLNQRGVAALSQLDKSQFGEFATFLRSLGAKI